MEVGGGDVSERDARMPFSIEGALAQLGWLPCEVVIACGFWMRLHGLMLRRPRKEGRPLVMVFPRCRSVHTCCVLAPLDIAMLDKEGHCIARFEGVPPWSVRSAQGACCVVERFSPQETARRRALRQTIAPDCNKGLHRGKTEKRALFKKSLPFSLDPVPEFVIFT